MGITQLIAWVIPICGSCQLYVGIGGGFSYNRLITNLSNSPFTKIEPKAGYTADIILKYDLNEWISIQTGTGLTQKNYSTKRTGPYSAIYTAHANSYLHLPAILQLRIKYKTIEGFLNTGIDGAYWIAGRVKGRVPNIFAINDSIGFNGQVTQTISLTSFNEQYHFDSRRDNRFELGWLIGIGLGCSLNPKHKAFIEWRYVQALTDQQKKYMINQVPRYNQTNSFSAGMLMALPRASVHAYKKRNR